MADYFNNDENSFEPFEENRYLVNQYEKMQKNEGFFLFDADEYEMIAEYYLYKNLVQKAYEVINYAIKQHPNSAPLLLKMAQIISDRGGNSKKIVNILEKALNLEPTNVEIALQLALALEDLKEYDRALKILNYAQHYGLAEEDIYQNKASLYKRKGDYLLAIEYMEKALTFEPNNYFLLLELADTYILHGNDNQAIETYNHLLNEYPESDYSWYSLGMLYLKIENYEKAEDCFDYALAINKLCVEAMVNKANILLGKEEYEEALELFEKAAIYEEIDPMLWCQTGLCYKNLEKYDEAEVCYLEALRHDDSFGETYFGLGMLAYTKDEFDKAIKHLKKAVSLANYLSEAFLFLGHSFDQIDDLISAEEAYQQAYEIDSKDAEHVINLLYIKYMNDKLDDVVKLAVEHIEKDHNPLVLMMYACILYEMGFGKESLEFMNVALDVNKESSNIINDFFPHLLAELSIADLIHSMEV
jgi:tetratricopeptide (TPR) repeat protein